MCCCVLQVGILHQMLSIKVKKYVRGKRTAMYVVINNDKSSTYQTVTIVMSVREFPNKVLLPPYVLK